MKPTGTTVNSGAISKSATRKLAADEVKFSKLNTDLKQMIGGAGAMLLTIGMARENPVTQADGMVVLKQNEKLCDDLTSLARQYEYVYKGLSYLVEGSVWSLVVGDLLSIGVAIAVNHGITIPFLSGSKDQVEEAQKKQIAILQQEIAMLRMQQMQEVA